MAKPSPKVVHWMKTYLRYVDYIAAAQLYLKDNFLVKEPLSPEHIKARILGHWGTVPGLNLIYAGLNYLVSKNKCEVLIVTGPGHGAPAILANLFAEKTLHDFYPDYTLDGKGMGKIIRDFSWPYTKFPSHVTPTVPGSILEGGELGYSLATAYGAALDNPNLIVAAVVGDGEAETGPIATAWHSNKFLNPKTSGAVLPIVHINGYKISNPTLYGTMSDTELKHLFTGYGYEPLIVSSGELESKTVEALETAYKKIRTIQQTARRSKKPVLKPKWPVILLRSPKGWKGVHRFHGHPVEKSFHAHGIPIENLNKDPEARGVVEQWLRSYKIEELVDAEGRPSKDVMTYVPSGKWRIGMNRHAIGGNVNREIKLPTLSKYETKFKKRGQAHASSMVEGAKMLRDVFKANPDNFRLFCPDELVSNKLEGVFEATERGYMWPVKSEAEHMDPNGRVIEMLSEHTLQGMLQGYLLTGRYGMFITYEAFAVIIASMVDQYAKFLKQSFAVEWRKPIPSAIYILTSVGWRQDHNGYSHQNPSFVSNVLQKHGEFCQIYYPSDANSLIAAFEESLKRKNAICVIVAGKRPLPQWQSLNEARQQAKKGMAVWKWVGGLKGTLRPDVVLASAGDYITEESLYAVRLCREVAPELNIRYVNISELTSLSLGDYHPHGPKVASREFEKVFTKDRPVVFSYHGYITDVEHILWPYADSHRFTIHGYREQGSTTTPFDIKVRNDVSCYQIAMNLVEQGSKFNKKVAKRKKKILKTIQGYLDAHQKYIRRYGDDPDDVKRLAW